MTDNQNLFNQAIAEILKSTDYMINQSVKKTTKIYDGLIVSANANGTYNIRFNNETRAVKQYGEGTPQVGQVVKVYIPQGNANLSYFALAGEGSGEPPVLMIPVANATTVGGIKANPKATTDTQAVKIDSDGFLWTAPSTSAETESRLNQLEEDVDGLESSVGNLGDRIDGLNAVQYTAQTLTDSQKTQARANIGAGTSNFSGSYTDLTNKPTIPSAVIVDVDLSSTSTNPVQNKTITTALAEKYSSANPPPYPVTSVNGQTGAVTIAEYVLPVVSSTALGGVKANAKGTSDTVAVKADTNGFLWVTPTVDSTTQTKVENLENEVDTISGNVDNLTTNVNNLTNNVNTLTTTVANLNEVKYTAQTLTAAQKAQARTNIGAGTSSFSGAFGDLSGKPTTLAGYGITDAQPAITSANKLSATLVSGLATVATSGSYNDLTDKPTIPPAVTVDSALSTTSTNPVRNSVVTTALNGKYSSSNPPPYPVTSVDGKTGDVITNAVTYTAQNLTESQKAQARANIGAGASGFSGSYNDLTDVPVSLIKRAYDDTVEGQPLGINANFLNGYTSSYFTNIQITATQPTNQRSDDLWFQLT